LIYYFYLPTTAPPKINSRLFSGDAAAWAALGQGM